jgi:hypothetical protein
MRVYISGPMTGYPELNYPQFVAAGDALADRGHEPVDPSRHPKQASWSDYLRLDLADLLTCDAVAVLPGWECSRGAALEVHVAHALGMTVLPIERWEAES